MGHGTGWSLFGLAQILDVFPKEHPEYNDLVEVFRELCIAAANVQDEDGSFHAILNMPSTLFCIHYVCWLGYAFLHGVRMGYLDESFRERGLKAWNALKARTFRGGVITSAAGTGVSRRLEYYLQRFGVLRKDTFLKGGGSQPLFLVNEVMRLKK